MAIDLLDINNFRNISQTRISPSRHINFIVGANGSGKTSVLETIYYLGSARSFRTPHTKIVIKHGEDQFTLFAKINNQGSKESIGLCRSSEVIKIKIGNTTINSASQLAGLVPVQLINPDVHKLMEEGPRHRRRYIEWGVFHVKPNYHTQWQECRHILKQRNAALKHGASNKEIEIWDNALDESSRLITQTREDYFQQLQPHIDRLIMSVESLPRVTVHLRRGWSAQKSLLEVLKDNRASDRKKGFTQFGPHRTDVAILKDNMKAKDIVSRGQQKLLAAILKIAQVALLKEQGIEQAVEPIVLVDDLPAELDELHRSVFMSMLEELSVQSFITSTSLTLVIQGCVPETYKVFHVEQGRVSEA